jgi:hypothetical protein
VLAAVVGIGVAVTAIIGVHAINRTYSYAHARTCIDPWPAPLDSACRTKTVLEVSKGDSISPQGGAAAQLYNNDSFFGTVSFPGLKTTISDYVVTDMRPLGIEVVGGSAFFTFPALNAEVWQGRVMWVADGAGRQYRTSDYPTAPSVPLVIGFTVGTALALLLFGWWWLRERDAGG